MSDKHQRKYTAINHNPLDQQTDTAGHRKALLLFGMFLLYKLYFVTVCVQNIRPQRTEEKGKGEGEETEANTKQKPKRNRN